MQGNIYWQNVVQKRELGSTHWACQICVLYLYLPTFRKICSDFFPQLHITVENDTPPIHPNTLQPSFAPKSGCIVGTPQNMVHCRGPVHAGQIGKLEIYFNTIPNGKGFISKHLPAQNDGLLTINPNADDAAVLLVVVVACGSYSGPDESVVGEKRTESCQKGRTWWKERQVMILYITDARSGDAVDPSLVHLLKYFTRIFQFSAVKLLQKHAFEANIVPFVC